MKVQKVARSILKWIDGDWRPSPAIHPFVDGLTYSYTSGGGIGASPNWDFSMYVGATHVRTFAVQYVGGSGLDIWGLTCKDEDWAAYKDHITGEKWN